MTDAPERIWARQTSGWGELQRGVYQNAEMDGYEYIRADLARPMTVADAAKVLMDNTPNPIFDVLKYPMMGEFKQSVAMVDEEGYEVWGDVTIEWTTIKEILAAALRALAHN